MVEKTIEKFVQLKGAWVPTDSSLRADILEGHSKECPYMGLQSQTYIVTKKVAEIEAKKGFGFFCWTKCDIKDCPTYGLKV